MHGFESLLRDIRACTICETYLPLGAKPVIQVDPKARILIAGQAPGRKVHESGVPFNDASGERLRTWMGLSRDVFYDSRQIALIPMGFCYPGSEKFGDLPPRPECAPAWRRQLLDLLSHLEMTLILGQYAQAYHFGTKNSSLTARVKNWQSHWPHMVPLPHPSPRNNVWLSKNPWFETELLPPLQLKIAQILAP